SRPFVDVERQMPRSHTRRPVFLQVKRGTSEERNKEQRRFFRRLLHVWRKKVPDLGSFEFLVKVGHHPEDVRLSHDSVDFVAGTGPLRWSGWWGVDEPLHSLILGEFQIGRVLHFKSDSPGFHYRCHTRSRT